MNRTQLEHVIHAAAAITGQNTLIVIGSQAILGTVERPHADLVVSMEADLISPGGAADATLIDGTIGEGSPFHATFGYHAHGVDLETATLPADWRSRLRVIESPATGGAKGLCLDLHDLAISKLAAGRPKDLSFVSRLLLENLITIAELHGRLAITTVHPELRAAMDGRIVRMQSPLS